MKRTIRKLALVSGIALALAAVGATMASDIKPRESMSAQVSAARLETRIQTSFNVNRHLRRYDLTAVVEGDQAVLSGEVEESVAKELAEQIALGVDGIKRVDNRIHVVANYERPKHAGNDRSFSDKVDDATTTASVKSKLLWNSHTDGTDIHVDTNNNKVTLTGTATTAEEKTLAGRIARDTEGVVAVNNAIALTSKPDTGTKIRAAGEKAEQKISDSWITAKVKSSFMFSRSVEAFDITVATVDGVVSLNGLVDTAAERDHAVQVARDVRGVKKVDASGIKLQ